jgi:hypothetical protein
MARSVVPPDEVGVCRVPAAVTDWKNALMAFAADDFGAWLVGILAEGGRRKLTAFVLGADQERALRQP